MAKAKPKAAEKVPSKNHFKVGEEGRERHKIGSIAGVECNIEDVRDDGTIRLVGERRKDYVGAGRSRQVVVSGILVPVYVDTKAVYIAPDCGDNGLAITRETLKALAEAVEAA